MGVYIRTAEHGRHISEALKGKPLSEETKRKLSLSHKGKIPWNAGKKLPPMSDEWKQKISAAHKGHTPTNWASICGMNKGKHPSPKTLRKLSESHKGKMMGPLHPNWKGGATPAAQRIRNDVRYIEWRRRVFERDGFTCQKCGDKTGHNLEAHHKKTFSTLLDEVAERMPLFSLADAAMVYVPFWDVDNGITLCSTCHRKVSNA